MRKDRETALKLRLGGKSYTEIQRELGVPKSTLSGWFSNTILSKEVQERIKRRTNAKALESLIRGNKTQTHLALQRAHTIRIQAEEEIQPLSSQALVLLGASLYWAEGYKRPRFRNGRELTSHEVGLTNSDPALVRALLRFLRDYCNVPNNKIKANIRLYENQNGEELQRFWQKETGIPISNFGKRYYGISKSSLHKRPFNRLPYGVIQVIVADTNLYNRIMGYIEKLKKLV